MPSTLTLSIAGALSLAAAGLGVHLGRAAVAEIDPAYFRDPEVPFHADLAANRNPDWAQVQAHEYTQSEVPITQCIGCVGGPVPDYPVEYVPGRDPYVAVSVDRWPAQPRRVVEREVEAPVYVPDEADPARERIVRYASFPVTQEEARSMAERDAAEEPPAEDFAATQ